MGNALWYFVALSSENPDVPLLYFLWGNEDSSLHRFCAKCVIVLFGCL